MRIHNIDYILLSPGDQSNNEGDYVYLDLQSFWASDHSGLNMQAPLMFSAASSEAPNRLPPGLSLDPQTGVISGMISLDAASPSNSPYSYYVVVTVQNLADGDTSTVGFNWAIYDSGSAAIVNLSRSGQAPRTKDTLAVEIAGIAGLQGQPVDVAVEWYVNGQLSLATDVPGVSGPAVIAPFDLAQPGNGDVGDEIKAVVRPNGRPPIVTPTVTVDNSPPVILPPIDVTGQQAYEDGIYYFVEGQQATIRIRVQDDDLEQSPGRETVRVSLAEGSLPPGLELPSYYLLVDANGEAVISGTIQPHGAAEPTQYYRPRFRAWDNSGSDGLSPFVALAATDLKVSEFYFKNLPANHSRENRIIIRVSATDVTRFTMVVKGVGAAAHGTTLYWTVFEDDLLDDDELWNRRAVTVGSAQKDGSFTHEIAFYLFADGSQTIAGPDDSSGEDEPHGIYGYLEAGKLWGYKFLSYTSNVLWLKAIQ